MTDIILGIGVAVFAIYTIFHIAYILSLKKAGEQLTVLFRNTEGNLNAALAELKATIENVKGITDDARAVTSDVRQIAGTVTSVQKDIGALYGFIKESFGTAAEANIAGLKAGIKTGVVTLVKNLQEGRSDDHVGQR